MIVCIAGIALASFNVLGTAAVKYHIVFWLEQLPFCIWLFMDCKGGYYGKMLKATSNIYFTSCISTSLL